jgi:iron complex transport system ATP-binding protein
MAAIAMSDVHVTRWSSSQQASTTLLHDVGWSVGEGEHWVVLGPNGAGKTTLLHLAAAAAHPTSGTVEVLGERLGRVDVRELRERIGLVDAGTARQLRPRMPGRLVVLTGALGTIKLRRDRVTPEHEAQADALLRLMGAEVVAERRWEACSQGERQRLLIARALMADPDLLLLDEPATGLDLPARERLIGALDALAHDRPDLPTVVITHHVEEIPASTTHALLLADGAVVAAGPAEAVLTAEHVSTCFGLPVDVSRPGARWAAALAG